MWRRISTCINIATLVCPAKQALATITLRSRFHRQRLFQRQRQAQACRLKTITQIHATLQIHFDRINYESFSFILAAPTTSLRIN